MHADNSRWSSSDDFEVGQPIVFQVNNYEETFMYYSNKLTIKMQQFHKFIT